MKHNRKNSITCSKKILLVSYICGITLTLITIIGSFLGHDMTSLGMITLFIITKPNTKTPLK